MNIPNENEAICNKDVGAHVLFSCSESHLDIISSVLDFIMVLKLGNFVADFTFVILKQWILRGCFFNFHKNYTKTTCPLPLKNGVYQCALKLHPSTPNNSEITTITYRVLLRITERRRLCGSLSIYFILN